MIHINELILSMLFLIPNNEAQQVLQQHKPSIIEKQTKYINLSNTYNTYLNNKEKKRIEEQMRFREELQKAEIEKNKKEQTKKGVSIEMNEVEFVLTFYTDLAVENGGYTVTCEGKKLRVGMVASNYYKLGTRIKLNGYGTVTVRDRGSSRFNKSNRLDVLVPRKKGESDAKYLKRVNDMGVVKVKGYVR